MFTIRQEVQEENALGLPAALCKRLRAEVNSEAVREAEALYRQLKALVNPPMGSPLPKPESVHQHTPVICQTQRP